MKSYSFFQAFVLLYTALSAVAVMYMIYTRIFHPYRMSRGYSYRTRQRLQRKKTAVFAIHVITACFIFAWLALALPWIDTIIGTHWFTTLHDGTMTTWFGNFRDNLGDKYFVTVLLGIAGVKGALLVTLKVSVSTRQRVW
ncbi:MAG: hypothetical protein WDN09_01640 [bacterium]